MLVCCTWYYLFYYKMKQRRNLYLYLLPSLLLRNETKKEPFFSFVLFLTNFYFFSFPCSVLVTNSDLNMINSLSWVTNSFVVLHPKKATWYQHFERNEFVILKQWKVSFLAGTVDHYHPVLSFLTNYKYERTDCGYLRKYCTIYEKSGGS